MLESLENIKKHKHTHQEKKYQPKSHHTGMDAFQMWFLCSLMFLEYGYSIYGLGGEEQKITDAG